MRIGLGVPLLGDRLQEAEHRDVANAVAETCWLRNLLRELHTHLSSATLVYCDNVSAVYLSCNSVQHQRTKHIEIDIHFVRYLVATGQKKYMVEILEKAHMVNCNPSRTPVDTESKLCVDGDPVYLHMHDRRAPHLSALKRI
nr:ribonuclease H-like domain-containing protein [Tanacetum cinerariifolium]GFA40278.1 ribonuclease H-like domain-containing protein [Tanacetum cinerariifolium]